MDVDLIWQFLRGLLLVGAVAGVMNLFFHNGDTSRKRPRDRDSD